MASVGSLAAAAPEAAGQAAKSPVFTQATYSSPIALSADNKLVWSVNPDDNSVSVVHTDTNTLLRTIRVGKEPQSVALAPNNKFAFVANAAANSVTVIKINNPNVGGFAAVVEKTIRTGAEPWNIVISPDGKRVFVANSGQDTISVINALTRNLIGNVRLRSSLCNEGDGARHFQPRGLAVSLDSKQLYVTRFLSFTIPGGVQGDDAGKQGVVCRLDINTAAPTLAGYKPAAVIPLPAQATGFNIVVNNTVVPNTDSTAFPNQLQSIVLRGTRGYLPNIAASPESPLQFQNSTQAYVNFIEGVGGASQTSLPALNLHLGARDPEAGKTKLFFANPWGIAFTTPSGVGTAYAISAGSDLLVKLNVDGLGNLNFTGGDRTTRYIDLNDPLDSATSGSNAGKNPRGIVIKTDGPAPLAYVANFVSRNISVVDLTQDKVVQVIPTTALPLAGSHDEQVQVGAEMFFSGRGHFTGPPGLTVSKDVRLSQDGWQNCASCHFEGLTDGVVWFFGPGPRKSIPMSGSFNPRNREQQRILNYSAQRDETQDFTLNVRNVSGPGPLAAAIDCSAPVINPPPTPSITQSTFDPNHGLLLGDFPNINQPPCVVNDFRKPNTGRTQVTVTLPGSTMAWPAMDALNEWIKFAIRVPNGPLTDQEIQGGVSSAAIAEGRELFKQARCTACHKGGLWTVSVKNFTAPPLDGFIFCETVNAAVPSPPGHCNLPPQFGNPNNGQYLNEFLRNVGSFNLGVADGTNTNLLPSNIGAVEKSAAVIVNGALAPQQDALGFDYNGDGAGNGFGVSSLLGIHAVPPYGHNGACETLACVVGDVRHRTANFTMLPDRLSNPVKQRRVVRFLESIDAQTKPFP